MLEQKRQTKFRIERSERFLHLAGDLARLNFFFRRSSRAPFFPQTKQIAEKRKSFFLSLLVDTGVGRDAVEPGRHLRLSAKMFEPRENFQKNLLRYVLRRFGVAAEKMQGDRINPFDAEKRTFQSLRARRLSFGRQASLFRSGFLPSWRGAPFFS